MKIHRHREGRQDFRPCRGRQEERLLGQIEGGEGGDIGADRAIIASQRQIRSAAALDRNRETGLRAGQRMDMAERQNELQRDGQEGQTRAKS